MAFWSVAQTETRREGTAARFLTDQGFTTYLPKIRLAHKRVVPLFPGYLFVRIELRWWQINQTIGVIQLLTAGDQPAQVRDSIVEIIKAKERGGIVRLPPPKGLRIGQQVRVLRGSFEGHIGLYHGMSGKDRERVLLDLLGRKVPVDFHRADIAPTPDIDARTN
jgi:transcriptional antiterminator RfaH